VRDAGTPSRAGRAGAVRLTAILSLGLVLNQIGLMAFPAVLPTLVPLWDLTETEAGWIGGIYFAGYAAAVPFMSGLTDRIDGRRVWAVASVIGAVASLAFVFAEGFWGGLAARFLSGVGLAGVHMPGLKLLAERTAGPAQARATGIYTAAYAVGSGGSFVVAGLVAAAWGWEWAFVAGAVGPLLAVPLLLLVPPVDRPATTAAAASAPPLAMLDVRPVLRNRDVVAWIACYVGNTWEVFAIRTWFVAFVVFNAGLPGNDGFGWNPALLSGISALLAVPATILIAELAVRVGRPRMVLAVTVASVLVCVALAVLREAAFPLVLALLLLHGSTSFGDTGSIAGGVVASADPRRRGLTLALYGFCGFVAGFLGPLAVGVTLYLFGGMNDPDAWSAAFLVMALGSALGAVTVLLRFGWRAR